MLLDTPLEQKLFESILVILSLPSPKEKGDALKFLLNIFSSLSNLSELSSSIPDSPPFKCEEHYISFAGDFDNDFDDNAEILCLRLQHDSLSKA